MTRGRGLGMSRDQGRGGGHMTRGRGLWMSCDQEEWCHVTSVGDYHVK